MGVPVMIASIQYLRAIAALLVVLYHACANYPSLFNPLRGIDFGTVGVYTFFVISGFIMFKVGRRESVVQFVYRRIVRVVPIYWICTTYVFIKSSFWLMSEEQLKLYISSYFYSILFIPHFSLSNSERIWPLLIPGWTLNYEMFFYLVFAISILLSRTIVFNVIVFSILVILGLFITPSGPIWSTYTSYIILYFIFGILIGWLYEKAKMDYFYPLFYIGGILISLSIIVGGAWSHALLFVGVPSFVLGSLANESVFRNWNSHSLHVLGDASYSIYLTHTLVINSARRTLVSLFEYGWVQFLFYLISVFILTIFVGVIVHFYVEKPIMRCLMPKKKAPTA